VKNFLCLFALIFLCSIPHADAVESIPKDTVSVEAVSFDSTLYKTFKAQKKFNYYNQKPDEPNLLQQIQRQFYRWLTKHFTPNLTEKQFNRGLIIALIMVLLLVILFLFIYKPSLFYVNRNRKTDYRIEEEDMEKTNFEKQIQKAIEAGEYQEAIRWNYLKILKILDERDLISFDTHKTVYEYMYEMKRNDLKPDFKNLSLQFVYYRYGNGEASRETFDKFKVLGDKILNS
jgi:cell division protein FtsL